MATNFGPKEDIFKQYAESVRNATIELNKFTYAINSIPPQRIKPKSVLDELLITIKRLTSE